MKKLLTLIATAFILLSCAAQAQIPSRNAVGYVKFTAEPGGLLFISSPFETLAGGATSLEELLEGKVPFGTTLFRWNTADQAYETVLYLSANTWISENGLPTPLTRGIGYFVSISDTGTAPLDVFIYGEVPGASSSANTAINLESGLNAMGYPYPGETTIEESGLHSILDPGDQVFVWDNDLGNYTTVLKLTATLYLPSNTVLKPGQGFFVAKSSGGIYNEAVPYSWPNN